MYLGILGTAQNFNLFSAFVRSDFPIFFSPAKVTVLFVIFLLPLMFQMASLSSAD